MVDAAQQCFHRALEIARARGRILGAPQCDEPDGLGEATRRGPGSASAPPLAVHLLHGRLRYERPQRSKGAPERIERLITSGVLLATTGGDSSGLIHIFITC